MKLTAAACAVMICCLTWVAVNGQSAASPPALPDWGGAWLMEGPTVFDRATVQPKNGRAGDAGVRESPPYNAEWEAIYRKHIELVKEGTFPDPISNCGTPHGFPRMMNVPDIYEFAVTPEKVIMIAENGPNILRIYTDGRKYPDAADLWPTYSGASLGHWEGDTLVFTTISLKGFSGKDMVVDRTGLVLSDASRVTTRMRKVDATTLEAQMVVEDPKAFTAPWHVTKRYRKQPAVTWGWDYACAENNRNPVSPGGKTLTLGPDGKPIDKVVD
jgi:hypothetical protein